MNIYYRVTQIDLRGTTFYELEIPFQSYYISIYITTTHPPHKCLAKYRPLSYFMIFPEYVLRIAVCPKDRGDNNGVKIEKPNRETLKLLIEKVGGDISSVGISGVRLGKDIVNEFLKTLY